MANVKQWQVEPQSMLRGLLRRLPVGHGGSACCIRQVGQSGLGAQVAMA
jgi:hypothetical protein